MTRAADRFDWTLDQLGARPGEHILEIGCGSGEALARLCARKPSVKLTGLDRSTTALQRARRKLVAVESGSQVDLIEGALPGPARISGLDRIFAINVNQFWVKPDGIFEDVRARLRPRGRLILVYETPGAARTASICETLALAAHRPGYRMIELVRGPDPRWLCLKAARTN